MSNQHHTKSLKILRVAKSNRSKKKNFKYFQPDGSSVKDKNTLERINKIRIPPNYDRVKISNNPNSKVQAIGIDNKGRKQYMYHPDFVNYKKNIKYEQYVILGKYLKQIQNDVNKIIDSVHSKPYAKWKQPSTNMALVIYLLDKCLFRIGNHRYYTLYGSHGTITLQAQHISLIDDKKLVTIKFIGKKGVINTATLTDTKIYNIFKTLKTKQRTSGHDFLFNYTSNKLDFSITGDDVQKFLSNYNSMITPKMFRTWHTNCCFIFMIKDKIDFLKNLESAGKLTQKIKKSFLKESMLEISQKLHNTPTVLKNSYLDNMIFDLFLNNSGKLIKIIDKNRNLPKEKLLILLASKLRNK